MPLFRVDMDLLFTEALPQHAWTLRSDLDDIQSLQPIVSPKGLRCVGGKFQFQTIIFVVHTEILLRALILLLLSHLPTLTPFGESDFFFCSRIANAFLALDDDTTSPEVDPTYYDPDRDILILEAFLNNEPPTLIPNQGDCLPETKKKSNFEKPKLSKSLIVVPPEVKLKRLTPILEYAFLEA
ncbi:hypothetical protein Tco_0549431 [Tanacetum coccineum]